MENILRMIDKFRALALKATLRIQFLRSTFSHRPERIFFLYLLAVLFYLPVSLFFPVWVLAIGPILWGIPHIFASFRLIHFAMHPAPTPTDQAGANWTGTNPTSSYAERESSARLNSRSFRFISIIWLLVTLYRVGDEYHYFQYEIFKEISYLPEIISMFATFLGLSFIYKFQFQKIMKASLVFAPVAALSWLFPAWTVGALLILHNWVAFYFWYSATQTRADRKVALVSVAIFFGIHALVWAGAFDPLYHFVSPTGELAWAGLDYQTLGAGIAPWTENSIFWFHSVVLYAFGQSLHYFVWLKAIPEQHVRSQNPRSFRQSWSFLKSELGPKTGQILLLGVLLISFVWVFLSYPQARVMYFAVAAYHGYMEISALGLSLVRSKNP